MALTDKQLNDLATDALDHARDNDYRPGADDEDMLATGISEAADAADIDLSSNEQHRAVQILRGRLDELDATVEPAFG